MTADALLALCQIWRPVRYEDMAYHASRDEILAYAESIPENEHHLWIGHDPGLTEAVKVSGGADIDRMPTATWAHFLAQEKCLVAFQRPPSFKTAINKTCYQTWRSNSR